MLAHMAGLSLLADNLTDRLFEGKSKAAAEYTYFHAMREGYVSLCEDKAQNAENIKAIVEAMKTQPKGRK